MISFTFQISPQGVVIRDEKVFRFAKDQSIPLLMLTSGKYQHIYGFLSQSQATSIAMVLMCTLSICPFSEGYMKSSARVIADSIINLSNKNLIELGSQLG